MLHSMFNNFTESRRLEITESERKDVFVAVLYDNSELFWVDIKYNFIDYGNSIEFKPDYRVEREQACKMSGILNNKIDEIVISAETLATDYEKELYFHDYVCEVTTYAEETFGEMGDTAYSALIDGKAICEGYSRAIQMLLDKASIPNYLVVGDGETEDGTEAHMWNIVEIDGKKYHLDATWNDTGTEDAVGYLYFNVNDELISRDHFNLVPAGNNCTDLSANYFVMNNLYIETFSNFNSLVSPVAQALKDGDNTVEILFGDENELKKAVKKLEKNNYEFFDFVSDAVELSGKNMQKDEIEYYTIDECNYFCLIFKEG